MNENTSIALVLTAAIAGFVCVVLIGRGCEENNNRAKVQTEELRQKSFQACVAAGRPGDECKRSIP